MILTVIGASIWAGWVLVGLVGGYMCGRLLTNGGLSTILNVIIGIGSAIGGGFAFLKWFGENYYGQTISLGGAVVACGIVLWLLNIIFPKHNSEEDI